jgi:hypothetical protein
MNGNEQPPIDNNDGGDSTEAPPSPRPFMRGRPRRAEFIEGHFENKHAEAAAASRAVNEKFNKMDAEEAAKAKAVEAAAQATKEAAAKGTEQHQGNRDAQTPQAPKKDLPETPETRRRRIGRTTGRIENAIKDAWKPSFFDPDDHQSLLEKGQKEYAEQLLWWLNNGDEKQSKQAGEDLENLREEIDSKTIRKNKGRFENMRLKKGEPAGPVIRNDKKYQIVRRTEAEDRPSWLGRRFSMLGFRIENGMEHVGNLFKRSSSENAFRRESAASILKRKFELDKAVALGWADEPEHVALHEKHLLGGKAHAEEEEDDDEEEEEKSDDEKMIDEMAKEAKRRLKEKEKKGDDASYNEYKKMIDSYRANRNRYAAFYYDAIPKYEEKRGKRYLVGYDKYRVWKIPRPATKEQRDAIIRG